MFRSLRFRLPALFLAGIALALLIASAVAVRLFQDYARQQSVRELQREAVGLTKLFGPQIGTGAKPYGARALEEATGDRIYYTGIALFPGENSGFRPLPQNIVDVNALPADRGTVFEFTPSDDDRRYLAVARPFEVNDVRWGAFAVAKPRAELQEQWVTLLRRLALGIVGGLLVAAGLAWWLSRRISVPMRELARAADQIAEGRYEVVIPAVPSGDEIGHLADRFREMAARLAESDERERSFLISVSHELRTPLNAMLGWAAMLRNGAVEPSRSQRAIEAIFNNATRQSRLIEELLDVSRIVAGRASFDLQNVDLSENIAGAVEAMMPLAAAKGVEVRLEATLDICVMADPRRLEQVFLNLLSNAVKFTPRGGLVTVHAAASSESAVVRVVDTGAGIEPSFLPHVFERFRQGDSATTRSVGGLGLGLYIARQLVDGQGGVIRVESEGAGRGATFTVTLPAAVGASAARPAAASVPAAAPDEPREPMPVLEGLRILLVDDEEDAREVMASALVACGATVVAAPSAKEALDILSSADVDLLLSDIAMPDQDGYALIREIRAMPSARLAAIPAAAVTAHARDDERERALTAGFQMHLTKPIDPLVLARAVATLAANARSSS
jgi:signal transduction histidine kinase/ActR/RegA family two-component response regulator